MISNDFFYYVSIITLLLFMLIFIACFVHFICKELGGVKIGKDSFLFFDYMLFGLGWKSSLPALAMILALVFGNFFDYIRSHNVDTLRVNIVGVFSMIFLFIHCRFFSNIEYDKENVKFIKEFLFNFKLHSRYVFLWLSRIGYFIFLLQVSIL